MAGAQPDLEAVRAVRDAVPLSIPVLLNTGARQDNVAQFLAIADGVIVGSGLKRDGGTWNPVDPGRVREFMSAVRGVDTADAGVA
jgi:predicted TIM-barrel enzyme